MKSFGMVLIAFALFTSGCAFTPQAVVLKPELQQPTVIVGNGQSVLLTVVDERPRSTLGTRGAQGVGAELTIAGDLSETVRRSIADGLQQQGFEPTMAKPSDGRELRVEIRNLDYRVVVGFWAGTLSTECGLKAICIRGSERPFERLYRGEHKESVQVVQTDQANEKYLNIAISKAINAMLQDLGLLRSLAQ